MREGTTQAARNPVLLAEAKALRMACSRLRGDVGRYLRLYLVEFSRRQALNGACVAHDSDMSRRDTSLSQREAYSGVEWFKSGLAQQPGGAHCTGS